MARGFPHGPNKMQEQPERPKPVTVDTVRSNEAMKPITAYASDRAWNPEGEKLIVRNIDTKLISIMALSYILQYRCVSLMTSTLLRSINATKKTYVVCRDFSSYARTSYYLLTASIPWQSMPGRTLFNVKLHR